MQINAEHNTGLDADKKELLSGLLSLSDGLDIPSIINFIQTPQGLTIAEGLLKKIDPKLNMNDVATHFLSHSPDVFSSYAHQEEDVEDIEDTAPEDQTFADSDDYEDDIDESPHYFEEHNPRRGANQFHQHDRASRKKKKIFSLLQEMKSEIRKLRAINAVIADALGACDKCFGEDNRCPACRGRGAPGYFTPDKELFDDWVAPVFTQLHSPKEHKQKDFEQQHYTK